MKNLFTVLLLLMIIPLCSQASSENKRVKNMSGPSENGALIYSNDIVELAKFYENVFAMKKNRQTKNFISLDKNGFNIIVHVPPAKIPDGTFSAIKLFLSVSSLEETKDRALKYGGGVFEGEWSNPIFKVANISDSDGNHIQIRQFAYNKLKNVNAIKAGLDAR